MSNERPARKPRTRAEMITYLRGHFRHDTMRSWNNSTSYAANIKIHRLEFPSPEVRARAWDLLNVEASLHDFDHILEEFAARHNYRWQIHRNGARGGYLVLYQGMKEESKHKSECMVCGQRNFQLATPENRRCGRCGEDERENVTLFDIAFYPGRSTDYGDDFEVWETDDLRERVSLIWDFDLTVERVVQSFIRFCEGHQRIEKVIMVPRTIQVAAAL